MILAFFLDTKLLHNAATGKRGYGNGLVPMSGVVDDVQTASAMLHHTATVDPEAGLKDMHRRLRSNQPLYRDASNIVEGYVLEEPKKKTFKRSI